MREEISTFNKHLYKMGAAHWRDMPWRKNYQPYRVFLSEIMLQQTQVARVVGNFNLFIEKYPNIDTLATSKLADVIKLWSGLGYNRRARYLRDSARIMVEQFDSNVPSSYEKLLSLPGVGPNTAGAICAYAFNQPVVFIETNVRTVFINEFYPRKNNVDDSLIAAKVGHYLDRANPRKWYWTVMDYGAWLKRQQINNIAQSKHYIKQSPFEGSFRQLRARALQAISQNTPHYDQLVSELVDERSSAAINSLIKDRLVTRQHNRLQIEES